ncbi:GtrA family protein [Neorhizobium galegae]|uniref:GtrA family protein n=1 Tax=Neorhizobium galegae TaxID=399 RepID=UPI0012864772|nr:GtrA family protein [Neorhizobium galegae]KAA9383090.1 hypothetical protein F4V88_22305 [Neorhizobium galegae]MCM2501594.1 GtrA family protein [Neorhizobium galegae]MCQ1780593.1 GtrA family protein [Neorhizobium galegae]MCQ1798471.1 GtrA family protein [Neorhizobium galegae]
MKVIRFGIVGLVQNFLSYGVVLILIWIGLAAWQAVLIVNPVAVALTFFVNRSWSFSGAEKERGQGRKYVIVYALAYLFAVSFTWAQETAGIPSWLTVIITTVTAALAVYVCLRLFVFRDRPEGSCDKP